MCDTLVIVEPNRVLFAKNSDRDANEGQNLVWTPRRQSPSGSTLRCTYIDIPDIVETNATLISQPFWMWGGEIGTNEHGVTIGNEAVFTNQTYEKEPGLLGMDLLRLALERASTARAAVDVITALLQKYGQGGGCGHENRKFTYHNSFIIADPTTAFVLETAGRKFAMEEVTGARSISNGLTISGFNEQYTDTVNTYGCGCRIRQPRTQALAEKATGVADMMHILQDHGEGHEHPHYKWMHGGLSAPCVHAGGLFANSQSTASWVSQLTPDACAHWATATSGPCTGLFKPVHVSEPIDIKPAGDTDDDSLWWRHEHLQRMVAHDPQLLRPLFIEERDHVQADWIANPPESAAAFAQADDLLAQWTQKVTLHPTADTRPPWAKRYWDKRNKRANISLFPATESIITK
ncbi:MAG: peptidase U34 [Candidatus Hydrogenedentota bacterium]|nr:MAG: peptidase U34 [Candidatus Hydrogenedentota bacterium]